MTREFAPGRLDVKALSEAGAAIEGSAPVATFERLSAEIVEPAPDAAVRWAAQGVSRSGTAGEPVPWVHLEAETDVPFVCQRCLLPVNVTLAVDRWFRFVADEATAAAEDEASEEDVLVTSREFDLIGLIEDELLMEIPVTPRHAVCPRPVPMSAVDPDFDAAGADKPHPFAALGALRDKKP